VQTVCTKAIGAKPSAGFAELVLHQLPLVQKVCTNGNAHKIRGSRWFIYIVVLV
jgi:hypothetical protein